MSTTETTDIKDVVKEKYGEAALRVKSGGSSCCSAATASGCCDPDHHQPLRRFASWANPGRSSAGLARVR